MAVTAVLLLSLFPVARWLSTPLEGVPISPHALKQAEAIVVLGGGVHYNAPEYGGDTLGKSSIERVRYGATLARQSGLPILVTGGTLYSGAPEGKLMMLVLENEFALPVRWTEANARNTAENAAFSAPQLKAAGIRRIALVTHAWHMPRARREFERQGMVVIPAPTGFSPTGASFFENLLPSTSAFERSTNAIHEWVGLALS